MQPEFKVNYKRADFSAFGFDRWYWAVERWDGDRLLFDSGYAMTKARARRKAAKAIIKLCSTSDQRVSTVWTLEDALRVR